MEHLGNKQKILLIEDDRNTRNGIYKLFSSKYDITIAEDGARGINVLQRNNFDLVLSDIQMPGANGLDVLNECLKKEPATPCILITAYGSIESAVNAIKLGAYDFVSKPIDVDKLELIIARSLEDKTVNEKNSTSKGQSIGIKLPIDIIGKSAKIESLLETIKQIAPTKVTVLLLGESGTGKEIFANSIHFLSGRKGPFIPVHCAALPANLLESELFGYEKGAFTGANEQKIGRFEMANNGTIFLDEIGEIDLSTQIKLLRVLENRSFERIGGVETINYNARIITATNKNLEEMVKEGKFREDLFFRLNVLNIEIPPLRERKEDIPLFINHFIKYFSTENNSNVEGIEKDALEYLLNYQWYGNIRELKNCIERMVILSKNRVLTISDIPQNILSKVGNGSLVKSKNLNIEKNEFVLILKALSDSSWNKTIAAENLGISRRTLHRKIKDYKISEDGIENKNE